MEQTRKDRIGNMSKETLFSDGVLFKGRRYMGRVCMGSICIEGLYIWNLDASVFEME